MLLPHSSGDTMSKKGKPTKKMPPPFVKGGKPGKGGKKC